MRTKVVPKPDLPAVPWIGKAHGVPYFMTENGEAWHPIGQNDAISWPELNGIFRRKDLASVEQYLAYCAAHGVTCLRLMMEYCHFDSRYFEKPAGHFQPHMVRLWDDLFLLCAKYDLRILLTPCDTFWMWIRWRKHPWNLANGGPCPDRDQVLLCPRTREAIKHRLRFAAERWGGSGTLFAWDLWNEIHPAYGGNSGACFHEFIQELSDCIRETELAVHGRTHPQTVSMFSPHMALHESIPDAIYRHPALDFCNTHLYEHGAIDNPQNTVDSAIRFGTLVREAIAEIPADRPYFDSEHGPIHKFKDKKKTLPADFDDEYFRHMQWAHLASGGAGGGMRWPNRTPHQLTPGMRREQHSLARFVPLVDWARFGRRDMTAELALDRPGIAGFGCGDEEQAIVYLLRTDTRDKRGMLRRDASAVCTGISLPTLTGDRYRVTFWDTVAGEVREQREVCLCKEKRIHQVPVATDLMIAVTPVA